MAALSTIKKWFAQDEKVLRNNSFDIIWTGLNASGGLQGSRNGGSVGGPDSGIVFGDMVPAKNVQFPGMTIEFDTQEFQGLRRQIPRKRNNTQQLLITFWLGGNLLVYDQIKNWMKAVSGFDDSGGRNRVASEVPYINVNNLYNDKIKDCFLQVGMGSPYGNPDNDSPTVALLGVTEVYPVAIQPINLAIDQSNEFATFDVLFNYVNITSSSGNGSFD